MTSSSMSLYQPHLFLPQGDNLLSVMTELASSPYLADPGDYRHGSMVFFDVIGYFMVVYPERMGSIMNAIVALVVFLGVGRKVLGRNGNGKFFKILKNKMCISY